MPDHSDSQDYQLILPFKIDGHELDGLSPQEVFVLGFEFSQVVTILQDGVTREFGQYIRTSNVYRVRLACAQFGWAYRIKPAGKSGWMDLQAAKRPSGAADALDGVTQGG